MACDTTAITNSAICLILFSLIFWGIFYASDDFSLQDWKNATLTLRVCIHSTVLQYWTSGESCQVFRSLDHYSSNQRNVYTAGENRVNKA